MLDDCTITFGHSSFQVGTQFTAYTTYIQRGFIECSRRAEHTKACKGHTSAHSV